MVVEGRRGRKMMEMAIVIRAQVTAAVDAKFLQLSAFHFYIPFLFLGRE